MTILTAVLAITTRSRAVERINCRKLFDGDESYAKVVTRNRPILLDHEPPLDMNCSAIKDYEFLEEQLAITYAEENVYCFAIDRKAGKAIRSDIVKLTYCLPNVVVVESPMPISACGHNQNKAHLQCMESTRDRHWKYAILMQNHDIVIKTHQEISQILSIYGVANDMEFRPCSGDRCRPTLETALGKLGLCPKSLSEADARQCNNSTLQWRKGYVQMSLSRATVDYILDELNVNILIDQLNNMIDPSFELLLDFDPDIEPGCFVDEILYQTLSVTPEIRYNHPLRKNLADRLIEMGHWKIHVIAISLPGRFTSKCESEGTTRQSSWIWVVNSCKAGYNRHNLCVYGVEDLPMLERSHFIIANKMMPDFDYAAISCIGEMLFNRTKGLTASTLNITYYENINLVRYHKERQLPGFSERNFEC